MDQDDATKQMLKRIQRSLVLLDSGHYSKARRILNPASLSSEQMEETVPQNVAWAAANAAGLTLYHAGSFCEADKHLRTALSHCQDLTSSGLSQDAYSDLAACLSDVAVNTLRWKGESEEAINLLKRALYMAERAYRPNNQLIESLRSNLAVAYLKSDPEQARGVVERSVKTRAAVQHTLSGGAAAMTDEENCGYARSLSVWAAVLWRNGQHAAAMEAAQRAHQVLSEAMGEGAADTGRAAMCVALLHWARAQRRLSPDDAQSHASLSLQTYSTAAAALRTGGLKASHPDRIAAEINVLVLEQAVEGRAAVRDRRRRCVASVRRLQVRDRRHGLVETMRRVLGELKKSEEGESLAVEPIHVPMLRCGLGLVDLMRDVRAARRRGARSTADTP